MKLKLLALTLLSCFLFPLALPNEIFLNGNPFLGLFCLSFLFWALYESPTYKFAALLGALFGAATSLLASFWLMNFNEYAVYTLGGTTIAYMGFNALVGVMIRGFSRVRPTLRPFLTAAVFTVYEFLKSNGFLGFPYALIAHPVHTILPFIQFVDLTGLWGLSFLCSYFSSLLAEAYLQRFSLTERLPRGIAFRLFRRASGLKNKALFALALIAIAFVYGGIRLALGFPSDKSLNVVLVQQNIDPWRHEQEVQGIEIARELSFQGIRESLAKAQRPPDLVVWSETALRYAVDVRHEFPFKADGIYRDLFPGLFTEFRTATLTGAPVLAPSPQPAPGLKRSRLRAHNAAILVTPEGRVPQFYAKQHPVPFVESIPFMEIEGVRYFFEHELGLNNVWRMGTQAVVFNLPLADGKTARFGAPICFEDVYPDICRAMVVNGAEALVNITNDSWSAANSALTQHLAAARFRAIETRTPLLRSTNAGLTCVIDPTGAIVKELPLFKAGYISAEVPLHSTPIVTLYTLLGDYVPVLLIILLMGVLFENAFHDQIQRGLGALARRGKGKTSGRT